MKELFFFFQKKANERSANKTLSDKAAFDHQMNMHFIQMREWKDAVCKGM